MHEGKMITRIAVSLWIVALAVSAAAPVCAQQTADDRKWIDQCVSDNKDEGQTPRVIVAYCTCMNNRMSNNETRSITEWEKSNPRAVEACAREAGWKGR